MRRVLVGIAATVAVALSLACAKPVEDASDGNRTLNANAATATATNRGGAAGVNDTLITLKVKTALLGDKRTSGLETDVDSKEGAVTLSGKVDTDEAKSAAEEVAKKIEGVRSVSNMLQVVAEARRGEVNTSDDKIGSAIEKVIDTDPNLSDLSLFVKVNAGVVTLSGSVETQKQLLDATQAIRKLAGVKAVDATQVTVKEDKKS
jgi:hyperosmotically inducible periplasmic protein